MKTFLYVIAIILVIFFVNKCNEEQSNPNQRSYEQSYNSTSTQSYESNDNYGTEAQSDNQGEIYAENTEENPYINNRLSTGTKPYNTYSLTGDIESSICIRTSSNSQCDLVAIVKRYGDMVCCAYIEAGDSYTFNVPNGTYQVFFYGGKGWNPNKRMPGGRVGGFVANESYSKDNEVSLSNQGLEYELIPQQNGNFSTMQSNSGEIF